jgi:hypothetical protein
MPAIIGGRLSGILARLINNRDSRCLGNRSLVVDGIRWTSVRSIATMGASSGTLITTRRPVFSVAPISPLHPRNPILSILMKRYVGESKDRSQGKKCNVKILIRKCHKTKQFDTERARYLAVFARRPRWSRCAIFSSNSILRVFQSIEEMNTVQS